MTHSFSTPTQEKTVAWAALPTTTTVVHNRDYHVRQISLTNTSAGQLTVTVTNAADLAIISAVPIDASNTAIISWPDNTVFVGGLKWSASGAGVNGEIRGFTVAY